jgi:hypothetical protein
MEASFAGGALNYVWFQLRLLVIAEAIWHANGVQAISAFRDTLIARDLTDTEILDAIAAIAPEAATALRHWPA